jgi:glutaredoxin
MSRWENFKTILEDKNAVTRTWHHERQIAFGQAYYLSTMHRHTKELATSDLEKQQRAKYAQTYYKVAKALQYLPSYDADAKEKLVTFQVFIFNLAKCDYKVTIGVHPPEMDCVEHVMTPAVQELLK